MLTLDSLASFGQIIDSVGGGGVIVQNLEITSNDWLPIQDNAGCYRFYEHETNNLGSQDTTESTVFGFTLDFTDSTAYDLLAECEDVQLAVTLTAGEKSQTYAFSQELVAQYVALLKKYPTMQPCFKLTVTGMDQLSAGTVVTVTPTITAAGMDPKAFPAMTYTVIGQAAAEELVATIDFTDFDNVEAGNTQQIWTKNSVVLTYSKGDYQSNLSLYSDAIRFQKGTVVEIAQKKMTKLVFRCLQGTRDYASYLVNSLQGTEGITAQIDPTDNTVVIVTFDQPTDTLTFTPIYAIRAVSLDVYAVS